MKKVVCKDIGEKMYRFPYRNCVYKIIYLQGQLLITKEKGNVENKERGIHRKNSMRVDIINKGVEKRKQHVWSCSEDRRFRGKKGSKEIII